MAPLSCDNRRVIFYYFSTTDAARLVSSEHNTHLPADHMGGPVLAGSTIGGLEETSLGEPN
eukprot:9466145-Pyramimonas_sp.AAC.4